MGFVCRCMGNTVICITIINNVYIDIFSGADWPSVERPLSGWTPSQPWSGGSTDQKYILQLATLYSQQKSRRYGVPREQLTADSGFQWDSVKVDYHDTNHI